MPATAPAAKKHNGALSAHGQIVLVLQGGGALGAYQAGVYQALHEAGVEPDWVIGTSIGAINASLIAGNPPEHRVDRLKEFWSKIEFHPMLNLVGSMAIFGQHATTWMTMMAGVPGFFEPYARAHFNPMARLGAEAAAYYSTVPLERTLLDLVDFDYIKSGPTRLAVGAANVRTSEMHYFDSRSDALTVRHVMASGALPPAFPAVRIGDDLYWDGGILSNTPVEAVFDDNPRRNSLVFAVHLWNPAGSEPDSIQKVQHRMKELQYSSRAGTHIARQRQIHKLRHIIAELADRLPGEIINDPLVRELKAYGCVTRMHVVRLLAPKVKGEDAFKDIDFSAGGIQARWQAGYDDTRHVLEAAPWEEPVDPLEGFVLHEAQAGVMMNQPSAATTIPVP